MALLEIDNLGVVFEGGTGERSVLEDVSMQLEPGEIIGVVGESGSGKTLLARCILQLLPYGARVKRGSIKFAGEELLRASEARLLELRGARLGMVFQEPMTSLNPALKVGYQLKEGLRLHTRLSEAEIQERTLGMLRTLGFRDPEGCLRRYPHEFSGGMRQRLMLASVLSLEPAILVADEPTTALDAVIARQVLESMVRATTALGTAVLLVSHDLSVVCRYAQRVIVMRHGRIVESGATRDILMQPRHPYTQALLAALPKRKSRIERRDAAEPIASVHGLRVRYARRGSWPWQRPTPLVLDGVDLEIRRGETLAIVGESGSGKTTLGRALLGLLPVTHGSIRLLGTELSRRKARVPPAVRRRAQLIFQDPFASLDPRMRVGDIVAEGLRHFPEMARPARRERVAAILGEVGLDSEHARRYPHELSGGQRQRVVIARALVVEPELVVADEPVSALDVTVQAQVLELLDQLQRRFRFAMLFVSHDLGVVARVADRIAIVRRGRVLEWGDAERILDAPAHPYTRELWSAVPRLRQINGGYALLADELAPVDAPEGCRFATLEDAVDRMRAVELDAHRYVLCVNE
jgi:peptide/nickel transport system ATP-binding protein